MYTQSWFGLNQVYLFLRIWWRSDQICAEIQLRLFSYLFHISDWNTDQQSWRVWTLVYWSGVLVRASGLVSGQNPCRDLSKQVLVLFSVCSFSMYKLGTNILFYCKVQCNVQCPVYRMRFFFNRGELQKTGTTKPDWVTCRAPHLLTDFFFFWKAPADDMAQFVH